MTFIEQFQDDTCIIETYTEDCITDVDSAIQWLIKLRLLDGVYARRYRFEDKYVPPQRPRWIPVIDGIAGPDAFKRMIKNRCPNLIRFFIEFNQVPVQITVDLENFQVGIISNQDDVGQIAGFKDKLAELSGASA